MDKALRHARELASALDRRSLRLVLAESCTAGWVSALLSTVPGISTYLCGSLVAYREPSKQQWLKVSAKTLADHTAESAEVTRGMVLGALYETPEAQLAAAITGHVGPNAPPDLDGICFVAIARRTEQDQIETVWESREVLASVQRMERQWEAASIVLGSLTRVVEGDETRAAIRSDDTQR